MRSPELVGRVAEAAGVGRSVERALRGAGGVVLVTGEAGIGKTRLVDEVARAAVEAGMVPLTGRAVEGGGTYRPIAEALLAHLRDERPVHAGRDRGPVEHVRLRCAAGHSLSCTAEQLVR